MDADTPFPSAATRRREIELAIQRRLVAHVAAGRTTDMAPTPARIPASLYANPARLRRSSANCS